MTTRKIDGATVEVLPGTRTGGTPRKHALGSPRMAIRAARSSGISEMGSHIEPGLEWVNSGLYKSVFTDGRHVYKRPNEEDDSWNLRDEFDMSERLAPKFTWVAPTSMYVVDGVPVCVQPYYRLADEDFDNQPKTARRIEKVVYGRNGVSEHVGDMGGSNFRVTAKGQVRVTDLSGG